MIFLLFNFHVIFSAFSDFLRMYYYLFIYLAYISSDLGKMSQDRL